jgi:hypothetical protein
MIAPSGTADSPLLNPEGIGQILRKATIWLNPKSVEGFDEQDFDFLPSAERQALTASVNRFREIARQVSPTAPATEEQIQQALPEFQRIIEFLRPDKYVDPEALVIGKRIEQQLANRLPDSVVELRFETGEDAAGGPALWIWVVFKDGLAESEAFRSDVRLVRELLERTVREMAIGRWPYVRFTTASELAPPAKKTKK